MKFLPFPKNVIIFQYKGSREKMNTALIRQYLDISKTTASHLRVTHVHISQKNSRKYLPFQKNVIILQSKASKENEHSSNVEQYVDISQTRASHFGVTQMRFSQKHFMKFLNLSKERHCLSK